MFYSKTTNAFYVQEIHGDAIPADAVSVSDERYQEIQAALSEGGTLYADASGYPATQPRPAPTAQDLQAAENARLRQYLAETDWYVVRYSETGVPIPDDVKQARAEAREQIIE